MNSRYGVFTRSHVRNPARSLSSVVGGIKSSLLSPSIASPQNLELRPKSVPASTSIVELLDAGVDFPSKRVSGSLRGRSWLRFGELGPVELGIQPAFSQEFLMSSALHDTPLLKHEDLIGISDCR